MALETKKISELTLLEDPRGAEIPASKGGVTYKINTDSLLMDGTVYGVEWDTASSNSAVTRVGNPDLHRALPIQSLMKRCVLNADGSVNYYLDENLSTLKANGTAANLTGADGNVMVEKPEFWIRHDILSATRRRVYVSQNQFIGAIRSPKAYVGAFLAAFNRTTVKLASVINNTADYRGGGNQSTWDGLPTSQLGMPVTNLNRIQLLQYARNIGVAGLNGKGWNPYVYDVWRDIAWLYLVEYANRNSQLPFNSVLDANGFKQGGLGEGATTVSLSDWDSFNGRNPIIPCGVTTSLGNKTGVVTHSLPASFPNTSTIQVNSYRGIEIPFGHIFQWLSGINIRVQSNSAGGRSTVFVASNPELFNDTNYNGYREAGDTFRVEDWASEMILGSHGDLLGKTAGGSSSTYWTDRLYHGGIPASGTELKGAMVGGYAYYGSNAGLFNVDTSLPPIAANSRIGSRLCFLP